eukprot:scaffold13389_cov134-Isochrysis_galbana.AAC.2
MDCANDMPYMIFALISTGNGERGPQPRTYHQSRSPQHLHANGTGEFRPAFATIGDRLSPPVQYNTYSVQFSARYARGVARPILGRQAALSEPLCVGRLVTRPLAPGLVRYETSAASRLPPAALAEAAEGQIDPTAVLLPRGSAGRPEHLVLMRELRIPAHDKQVPVTQPHHHALGGLVAPAVAARRISGGGVGRLGREPKPSAVPGAAQRDAYDRAPSDQLALIVGMRAHVVPSGRLVPVRQDGVESRVDGLHLVQQPAEGAHLADGLGLGHLTSEDVVEPVRLVPPRKRDHSAHDHPSRLLRGPLLPDRPELCTG